MNKAPLNALIEDVEERLASFIKDLEMQCIELDYNLTLTKTRIAQINRAAAHIGKELASELDEINKYLNKE